MVLKVLGVAAAVGLLLVMCGNVEAAGPTAANQPVVLGVGAAGKVAAAAGNPVSRLPAGPLADLLAGRTYTISGAEAGKVLLRDLLTRAPGPNGPMTVTAVRALPWSAIAKGVGRAVPLVGTALTIKDLLDAVRCREKFGGGNECDEGQNERTEEISRYDIDERNFPIQRYETAMKACEAFAYSGGVRNVVRTISNRTLTNDGWTLQCSVTYEAYSIPDQTWTPLTAGHTIFEKRGSATFCPPVVINNQTINPAKGPDGKCPTLTYAPATEEQVSDKVEQWGNKGKAVDAARELDQHAVPMPHPEPTFEVPPKVIGPRQQTEHPDGSVTVRDPSWDLAPEPGGYGWVPKVVETNYPPGTAIPPQDQPPTVPGTTTTGAPAEFKSCGLPDSPACKIDESGTPPDTLPDPEQEVGDATDGIRECISNPAGCFPTFPTLDWAFTMPTACGLIPLPAFAPYLTSIDICQFQPVFHDLMSVAWIMGGIFGALSLFWRKTLAS